MILNKREESDNNNNLNKNLNFKQEINPFDLACQTKEKDESCDLDSSLQGEVSIRTIKLTNFEVKLQNCFNNNLQVPLTTNTVYESIPFREQNEEEKRQSKTTSNNLNINDDNQQKPLLGSEKTSQINTIPHISSHNSISKTENNYHLNQLKKYKQEDIAENRYEFEKNYVRTNIDKLNEMKMKNYVLNSSTVSNKGNANNIGKMNRFTSYYRKKVETAIFLFNTNQYEKAYNSLIESEIIQKRKDEFAKALLLISGFDKILIGDFLSGESRPNENFSVAKLFIKQLNFDGDDLIDSLRFLLSVLVLPLTDMQKVKNILKIFSTVYFNDSKDETKYKNSDEILSICLVALDIDKIIKTARTGITMDEFIQSHPNVDSDKIAWVYQKLKEKTLNTICHEDYKDLMIKKIIINQEKNDNYIKNNVNNGGGDNYINQLKKREGFDLKIKNQLIQIIFYLNENEQHFVLRKTKCDCFLGINQKIPVVDITNIFIGNYSTNKSEYEFYITIETKVKIFELKHSNKELLIRYVTAIKKLINKKKSLLGLTSKQKITKENISSIWQEIIIKNWAEYRDYLLIKTKRKNFFSTKNIVDFDSLDKPLKIKKEQVLYLWTLGLPSWLRPKMWQIIIDNQLDISENLCNGFISQNLNEENEELNKDINQKFVKHIKKIKNVFEFANNNINFDDYIQKILIAFCLYRPDIMYCKPLAYIASIFIFNSENYYNAFVLMCNFVIPNCLFRFILEDENLGIRYITFFSKLFKSRLPKLYEHFSKFGVEEKLYFYKWAKYLFALTFPYETLLRIWDCFLLKGDIFIFEVAISILTVLEKDLINSSFNEIFSKLLVFPVEYIESELFDTIEKLDISKEYKEEFEEYEIGREKGELLKDV